MFPASLPCVVCLLLPSREKAVQLDLAHRVTMTTTWSE